MCDNENQMELSDIESTVISHDGIVRDDSAKESFCCFHCCYKENGENSIAAPYTLDNIDDGRKVLVLDLDETLVHCTFYPPDKYDLTVSITIENVQYKVFVQKRPFLDEFLSAVLPLFYVVIFTASLAPYANPIIDEILPQFPDSRRLFRDSCTFSNGMYVKNLEMFKQPLSNVIIVDNNPCSFAMNPANGVLSATWEGDNSDTELLDRILPILKKCNSSNDVRVIISESSPRKIVPTSPLI